MSARREPLPGVLHVAPELRVAVLDTPIAQDAVDMLKVALSEIASGRAVFPVWGVEQVIDAETGEITWRCRCGGRPGCRPGKHPVGHLAPQGFKNATKNAHRATQWFTAEPNANVGVVTGAVSGFDVVDIDPKHGGSLEAWEARFGPHPGGSVRTGSGGWHLEVPHTSGVRDRNLQALGLGGIEIKADGGFVLAGGSLHIRGTRYERVRAYDASCQPLPEQVSTHCQGKATKVDSWASGAVEGIVADFRLTELPKNKALFIAAMKLASIAATGRIGEAQITTVLLPEASAKGIDQKEALRQIANGIERGRQNPRHIPAFNPITNRSEACDEIERWFLGVSADPLLIGREGLMVKKILTGLYLDALRAGKVRFGESWRQVARSAGVSATTAFKRRDSELLRRHVNIIDKGSYGDNRAATWMLTRRDFTATEGSESVNEELTVNGNRPEAKNRLRRLLPFPANSPLMSQDLAPEDCGLRPPATITRADPADDLWYRWPGGWALYSLLSFDSGASAAKLAELTELSRGSVGESLRRLRKEGFARYDQKTYLWFKAGDDQPTIVEQKWGENRAHRHEAERHAYDSTRARTAEEDAHLRSLSPAERKKYLDAKKRAKGQAKLRNLK